MNKQRSFNSLIALNRQNFSKGNIQSSMFFSLLRGEKMSEGQMRGVLMLLQVHTVYHLFIQRVQAVIAQTILVAQTLYILFRLFFQFQRKAIARCIACSIAIELCAAVRAWLFQAL